MLEIDDQHDRPRVLNPAKHPPVIDAVAPEAAKFARECYTPCARIARRYVFEVGDDPRRLLPIEFLQCAFGPRAEINLPGQARLSSRPTT